MAPVSSRSRARECLRSWHQQKRQACERVLDPVADSEMTAEIHLRCRSDLSPDRCSSWAFGPSLATRAGRIQRGPAAGRQPHDHLLPGAQPSPCFRRPGTRGQPLPHSWRDVGHWLLHCSGKDQQDPGHRAAARASFRNLVQPVSRAPDVSSSWLEVQCQSGPAGLSTAASPLNFSGVC